VATSFFGGAFFGGEFFNAGGSPTPTPEVVKTGTGGIDPPRAVKPVPFLGRGKKAPKDAVVERRVEETREIHAEVAGKLARELRGELEVTPITEMSLLDVDREIGVLLRKVQRTQDEEILLLLLMAVA